jgi:hypothetical protein
MGYEYRLDVIPRIGSLEDVCSSIFAETEWTRIPTSFTTIPDGIGVQFGDTPANANWPHAADLCVEDDGQVYVLCHGQSGGLFMNALIAHLESTGHSVAVDDDI